MKNRGSTYKIIGYWILAASLALTAAPPFALAGDDLCLQDSYNRANGTTGTTLNCTANDVKIATLDKVVPAATDSGLIPTGNNTYKCVAGSTVRFTGTFKVVTNATQRYDIGLYIAEGQISAKTGSTCNKVVLTGTYGSPGYSVPYDNFTKPADSCGDVTSSHSPYAVTLPIETTCQGSGTLKLPNCTSWIEKEKKPCGGIQDAVPGAPSKCYCDDTFTTNLITVEQPSLTVAKKADKTSVDPTGGTVTYTATVTNVSTQLTVNLSNLSEYGGMTYGVNKSCGAIGPNTASSTKEFTYDFTGGSNLVSVVCGTTTLIPGASTDCTFTSTLLGNPSDKITDMVCVNGTSTLGTVPQACSDCVWVSINDVNPTATVDKSVVQAACATVTYKVTVVNNDTYNRPLTLTALNDDKFGDITKDKNSPAPNTNPLIERTDCALPSAALNVGDTPPFSCTFDAVVCRSTNGVSNLPHTNTVRATLTENANTISPTGSITVTGFSVQTQ